MICCEFAVKLFIITFRHKIMYGNYYAKGCVILSRRIKNTMSLLTKFAKSLDFPSDTFGNIPTVEIKGDCEATVYGCTKVLDYSADNVILAVAKKNVNIEGRNLVLSDFTAGAVSVCGTINCVRFTNND